jgi:hypothetical protein
MGKQVNFYLDEKDKPFILNIFNEIFENPIDVPYYKSNDFKSFDFVGNEHKKYHISELARENDIIYRLHEYSDGKKAYILDTYKSPVFEFDQWFKNIYEEYVEGRFYIDIDRDNVDLKFSKKVSKLFLKIKNEFWYYKKGKIYISKNIDIENSLFLYEKTILKNDLK